MSKEYTIKVHVIQEDGLPPDDLEAVGLTGRVVFIFDGCLYSGWPIRKDGEILWEDSETAQSFSGVEKWIELPVPGWSL